MTIALEALDARYLSPQPRLNHTWLNAAIGEVLTQLDAMLPRFTATFPAASATRGRYESVEKVDWTEGFWTGMLWLAWEVTGDDKYRAVAESLLDSFEERLDKQIKVDTHDLGFLYLLSCVNAWKLTGNLRARELALRAAELLYRRFNATAGVIQAWGDLNDPARQGRMIIDCNLNVPLLFWAANETGNQRWREAASRHLAQAARYLVREDASTFHTFYMDVHSGQPLRAIRTRDSATAPAGRAARRGEFMVSRWDTPTPAMPGSPSSPAGWRTIFLTAYRKILSATGI